jgi:DNA-binding MltR family transcriptional regulator
MAKKQTKPASIEGLSSEINCFYQELQRESDRGVALVGAAYLDDTLELMLKRFFVDDGKVADSLLSSEAMAPLGTFSGRTKLAYCMGLIGPKMFEDLNTIRSIRNAFAHRHSPLTFNDESLCDRCRNIHALPKRLLEPDWSATPRDCFLTGVVVLANQLLVRALSIEHVKPGEDFRYMEPIRVE